MLSLDFRSTQTFMRPRNCLISGICIFAHSFYASFAATFRLYYFPLLFLLLCSADDLISCVQCAFAIHNLLLCKYTLHQSELRFIFWPLVFSNQLIVRFGNGISVAFCSSQIFSSFLLLLSNFQPFRKSRRWHKSFFILFLRLRVSTPRSPWSRLHFHAFCTQTYRKNWQLTNIRNVKQQNRKFIFSL